MSIQYSFHFYPSNFSILCVFIPMIILVFIVFIVVIITILIIITYKYITVTILILKVLLLALPIHRQVKSQRRISVTLSLLLGQ